jgi:hypothetical protein
MITLRLFCEGSISNWHWPIGGLKTDMPTCLNGSKDMYCRHLMHVIMESVNQPIAFASKIFSKSKHTANRNTLPSGQLPSDLSFKKNAKPILSWNTKLAQVRDWSRIPNSVWYLQSIKCRDQFLMQKGRLLQIDGNLLVSIQNKLSNSLSDKKTPALVYVYTNMTKNRVRRRELQALERIHTSPRREFA